MKLNKLIAASAFTLPTLLAGLAVFPSYAADGVITASARAHLRAQTPGVYQYRIGEIQVTALSDGTVPQDLHKLLTNTTSEKTDELLHHAFLANPVEASINAYLIDTGSRLVLVDTGAGAFFGPGYGGKLLANLRVAGYGPEQIDDILITHIHTDHSGGLTVGGNMIFPNASIHIGKPDIDFFLDPSNSKGVNGYDEKYFKEAVLAVGPYMKAGKVRAFSGDTQILPQIRAVPAAGHTPGHSFYVVESNGESMTFIGDIVHVASVQFPNTDIAIVYDVDSKHAVAERQKQFAAAAANRSLVAGAHLPFPGIGHVRAEGDGYAFVPVGYRDR